MRLHLCASLAVLLSVSAASAAAAAPVIYNLGTLGGTSSSAADINNSGQITGSSSTAGDAATHAFLYRGTPGIDGIMYDLGTLGGANSAGEAINNFGQVAGSSNTADSGVHGGHAFLYTGTPNSGGVMHDLATVDNSWSAAHAINDSGQVAGFNNNPNSSPRAFRYIGTPGNGGIMQDLGTLGGFFSSGDDINAAGQVAGYSYRSENEAKHAILYTGTPGSGGIMHDLEIFFGGAPAWSSSASAINESGQMAGWCIDFYDFKFHAFLYTGTPGVNGFAYDLGHLGGTTSFAQDINAGGQVVGYSATAPDATNPANHAFVYTGTPELDGVIIDLDAWLDASNPAEGAKWTLERANGLNDNGLIIGTGYYDDGPGGLSDGGRAFLLDASSLLVVPEPSSLALLIVAVGSVLRRKAWRFVRGDRFASRLREE